MANMPVKVYARVRPVMAKADETADGVNIYVNVNAETQAIVAGLGPRQQTYTFDHILGMDSDQRVVWDALGPDAIEDIWQGQNVNFVSYGSRGSGKRYTTYGTHEEKGIFPRFAEALFSKIDAAKSDAGSSFKVELSLFESYCETLHDLLNPSNKNLHAVSVPGLGATIGGLTCCAIDSHETLMKIANAALTARSVRAAAMNSDSSNAHLFFQVVLSRTSVDSATMKAVETTSSFLIADIGEIGSANTAKAPEENTAPSSSHAALRSLVSYIIANQKKRKKNKNQKKSDEDKLAVYEKSQLTQLLQGAIGGDGKTVLLLTLSPTDIDAKSSSAALKFASRFQRIKNSATSGVNRRATHIQELKAYISMLRQKVAATSSADDEYTKISNDMNALKKVLESLAMPWEERCRETAQVIADLDVQHQETIDKARLEVPHLMHISKDTSTTHRILHFLKPGKTQFGRAKEPTSQFTGRHDAGLRGGGGVALVGLSLDTSHCAIKNEGGKLTLINMSDATCVQGQDLHPSDEAHLNDGDWLVLGKLFDGHVYEVVIPKERNTRKSPSQELSWSQVAAVMKKNYLTGLQRQQQLVKMDPPDIIALRRRVLVALPQIEEANALAKSLSRPRKFNINIIARAKRHADRGRRLSTLGVQVDSNDGASLDIEIIVQQSDDDKKKPSIWTEAKFLDRIYSMRSMHILFLSLYGQDLSKLNDNFSQDADPFFDPYQDVHVGTAVAYLSPLAYVIPIDQPITILDDRGSAEGELILELIPRVFRDEFTEEAIDTDDENEPRLEHYLGGILRLDVSIKGIKHLDPIKSEAVYVVFKWFGESDETKTSPSTDTGSDVSLDFKRTYNLEVTKELVKLVNEDVVEFSVMCRGNSKNLKGSAPRLGFLSEVGISSGPSFTPRNDEGSRVQERNRGTVDTKSSGGELKLDMDFQGNGGYGSAVDAHKNELEKEAMRRRIAELEDELAHTKKKSSACALL